MNLRRTIVFFLFSIFVFFLSPPGNACTTFVIDNGEDLIFGRNYDWRFDDGLVIINKRGVEKAVRGRVADKSRSYWGYVLKDKIFKQLAARTPGLDIPCS